MSGTKADHMFFDEDAFKPTGEEMKNDDDISSLIKKAELQGKPLAEFTEEMKEEFIKGIKDPQLDQDSEINKENDPIGRGDTKSYYNEIPYDGDALTAVKENCAKQEEKKHSSRVVIGSEIGNIYYQYVEETDSFNLFRVMKIQNGNTVTCSVNGDLNNRKKFNLLELKKNYSQLCSNYVMSVSRVTVGVSPAGESIEDIVIMLYKRLSSDAEFTNPDVVCRQGISDVFYEPYCTDRENQMVGISITPETTPVNYEFRYFYEAFDQILDSIIVNLYMTDTLDTIIALINPSKWDDIPLKLLMGRHNFKRSHDFIYQIKHPKEKDYPDEVDGYCKDVRTLLKSNNFMYDFYSLHRIVEVTFKIEWNDDGTNYSLPEDQKAALQDLYEVNMDKTIVGPYDYSIDLDVIRMPYVLVVDNTGVLYIVGYTRSADEYVKVVDTSVIDSVSKINEKLAGIVNMHNKYSE